MGLRPISGASRNTKREVIYEAVSIMYATHNIHLNVNVIIIKVN
jgi:hypothetical protein